MPGPPERKEQLRYLHALWKADQEFAHKLVDPLDVDREIKRFAECVECGADFEQTSHGRKRCQACFTARMEKVYFYEGGTRKGLMERANDNIAYDVRIKDAASMVRTDEWFKS